MLPDDTSPLRIRKLILLFIGLLMVVPLIGFAIVKLYGPQIERDAYANLGAVARLKAEQIEYVLNERDNNSTLLMTDVPFVTLVDQFVHRPHDTELSAAILDRLGHMQKSYDYESIMLLGPGGQLLLMQGTDAEMLSSLKDKLKRSLSHKEIQRSNLFRDTAGDVHMDWVVPLITPASHGARPVAAIVLRITANRYLFPLIQTWPTASPSAEILLVRRENDAVVYLNELRHRKGTALTLWRSLHVANLPAAIALRAGNIGTTPGRDHRNVAVLSAYRPVAGTDWHIIAKVDRDEVLTPLHQMVLWISLIAFFAVLALSLLIFLFWRQQQRTQDMKLSAEKIKADHLLQQCFHLSIIGMAITDSATKRWVRYNSRLCAILGYAYDELANLTWADLTHPDDIDKDAAEFEQVLRGESDGYTMEKRFICKDGRVVFTIFDVKCIRSADNRAEEVVTTIEDITERKRAEQELQASLSLLKKNMDRTQSLLDSALDAVVCMDQAGKVVGWNPQAEHIFGYTQEQAMGREVAYLIVPPAYREAHRKGMARFIGTGKPTIIGQRMEITGMRADGSEFPMELTVSALMQNGAYYFSAYARDITERKHDEEELRIAAIAFESQEGMVVTNANTEILRVNRSFTEITGYTAEEVVGRTPQLLSSDHHGADFFAKMWETINRFSVWQGEVWNRRKDGELYPEWLTITAVRATDGKVTHYIGTMIDITKRKRIDEELILMRDRALESVKLKSQFLSNMSHEIRTPMNGVIGMTDLLLDTQLEPQQLDFVETIRDSAQALLTIINDILDFSKIEAGKLEVETIDFSLRQVVEGSLDILSARAYEKQLTLTSYVDPAISTTLMGDPGRLRQIIINLTGNAIKFTETGEVVVRVTQRAVRENQHLLRFEFHDTGIGMSKAVASKLFQPFTQADGSVTRKYGGTGLGLSISKQLVELMQGQIDVNSEEGQGSTFWIELTLERGAYPDSVPPADALTGIHALIVLPQTKTRQALTDYLQSWGMQTAECDHIEDALQQIHAGKQFDVAFIPREMPGIRLAELTNKLTTLAPELKLVLISRNMENTSGSDIAAAGFHARLHYPVKQSSLQETLLTALGFKTPEETPAELPHPVETPHPVRHQGPSINNALETGTLILLVEDNAVNQKVAIQHLQKLGYTAHVVDNGMRAVEAVISLPYGLVLMDCQMPVMDGFEATSTIRLREYYTGQHVPIVAMTANAMPGDRERCHSVGMDDYLTKPISPETLKAVLDRWLPKPDAPAPEKPIPEIIEALPGTQHQVVDMARLMDFFDNDAGMVDEMLEIFTSTTTPLLDSLKSAVEASDFAAIKSIGHQISGSASNLYLAELTALGQSAEQIATQRDVGRMATLHDALQSALHRLEKHMQESMSP